MIIVERKWTNNVRWEYCQFIFIFLNTMELIISWSWVEQIHLHQSSQIFENILSESDQKSLNLGFKLINGDDWKKFDLEGLFLTSEVTRTHWDLKRRASSVIFYPNLVILLESRGDIAISFIRTHSTGLTRSNLRFIVSWKFRLVDT